MKQNKILVFDVDGTLYDMVNNEIPVSTIQAIQKAKENGYVFVIATGRAHYGLGKALMALKPDFILSVSGGVVVDSQFQVISHHDFTKEDCEELLDFCHKEEAGLIFKFIDYMYIYQHPEKVDWLVKQMNSDIGKEPFIDCPMQNHHKNHLPQSASVHANPEAVKKHYGNHSRLQFIQYSKDGYDVVLKGMNKAVGLQDLLKYLHKEASDIICFGDNYNDLEMMQLAGFSVAMGNAVDEVKQIADYVTDTSNHDGIAKALTYLKCID